MNGDDGCLIDRHFGCGRSSNIAPTARSMMSRWFFPSAATVLTAFSDADPVTAVGERVFQERMPGAKGQPHVTVRNAGHFLQEDASAELVRILHDFIESTR